MNDSDWDDLQALIAEVNAALMINCMLGTIIPFATDTIPDNMLLCDGSSHLRVDYPQLYAALHSTFITDANNFTVPNLSERFIRGRTVEAATGNTGGADSHALTVAQMPVHYHNYGRPTFNIDVESVGVPDPTGLGLPLIPTPTTNTGNGASHPTIPKYMEFRYGIVYR